MMFFNMMEVCVRVGRRFFECVEREFKPLSDQTKDYKICICCFYATHAALRRNIKAMLAGNQDNMP
jgi:hypothetical protein